MLSNDRESAWKRTKAHEKKPANTTGRWLSHKNQSQKRLKPKNSTHRSQLQVYLGHHTPITQTGPMYFGPIPLLLGCVFDVIILYTVPVFYSKHTEHTVPVFGYFSLTFMLSARAGGGCRAWSLQYLRLLPSIGARGGVFAHVFCRLQG